MTPETSGWYDDPNDPAYLRYFDGVVWTDHRAPKELPDPTGPDPHAPGTPQAAGAGPAGQGGAGHAPGPGGAWGAPGAHPGAQGQGAPPWGRPPAGPGQQWGGRQPGGQQWGGQQWGGQPPWGAPTAYPGGPVGPAVHGRPLATWWARVAAYLLDGLIVGFVGGLLALPFASDYNTRLVAALQDMLAGRATDLPAPDAGFVAQTLVVLACYVVYDTVLVSRLGRTVGHMALGLRVLSVVRPERLGLGAALARAVVKHVGNLGNLHPAASVLSFVTVLDYLWPLWDKPHRQALHDKVAKSVVVRDR